MKTHGRRAFALADHSIPGNERVAGFTLVELLVVIAIIGMLMALLLPAVQQAKETARRNTCLNNMKQLSIAVRNYENSKRELPGYANRIAGNRLATWVIVLFPYMERTDIWSKWNDPAATPADLLVATPYIELLACPSNPPTTLDVPWLAYVANCGRKDSALLASSPPSPAVASGGTPTPVEKLANGVFFDRYSIDSRPIPKFMQFSMSLDKIPDGASNTLMLSENTAAYYYTYRDQPDSTMPCQYESAKDAAEPAVGFLWDPTVTNATNPPDARRINRPTPPDKKFSYQIQPINADYFGKAKGYYYSRPSSQHPGGVNVAMCGGELFFMREEIDYKVYEQLMTSDGKHSDMPVANPSNPSDPRNSDPSQSNRAYLLQDADYK